jgi:hypothetical protein
MTVLVAVLEKAAYGGNAKMEILTELSFTRYDVLAVNPIFPYIG